MLIYEIEGTHDKMKLKIRGRIDSETAHSFNSALDELLIKNPAKVIIDFEGVDFINSSSIGSLIYFYKRFRKDKNEKDVLIVEGAGESLLHVFKTVHLHKLIKINNI